jgi:hypothetical protein
MKRVVIFADIYQKNHESLYKNVAKNLPRDCYLDFIVCNKIELSYDKSNKIKFHIKEKSETILKFMISKKLLFDRADLIIIEELYMPNLAVLVPIIIYGHKSLQIIHNANKFLNRTLKLNFKSIVSFIFFKIIKLNIKGVIVISQNVKEYILDKKLFERNIYYIPFSDSENEIFIQNKNSETPIKFTIPGTVNTERRNYKIFLKVFIDILENNPGYKLKLCFLGRIVKIDEEVKELIKRLKEINPKAIDLWTEYIDDETYHDEILSSNFLIGNINIEYTENNIKEIYGQSKETGVLFLMLKYKIPTLFPKEYSYSKLYKGHIISYTNTQESLYKTVLSLLNLDNNAKNISFAELDDYVRRDWLRIYNEFLDIKNTS